MGNVKMVNRQRTRERRTARILLPRGLYYLRSKFLMRLQRILVLIKLLVHFLFPDAVIVIYQTALRVIIRRLRIALVLRLFSGLFSFSQRFGARNRSLKIREIQSFRLKKIYLHILSNSVNMCLKKTLIIHDNKSHFAGAGFVVNNF